MRLQALGRRQIGPQVARQVAAYRIDWHNPGAARRPPHIPPRTDTDQDESEQGCESCRSGMMAGVEVSADELMPVSKCGLSAASGMNPIRGRLCIIGARCGAAMDQNASYGRASCLVVWDEPLLVAQVAAVVAFCLIGWAVYIGNDWIDRDADRVRL
jgi:hypothetical protein